MIRFGTSRSLEQVGSCGFPGILERLGFTQGFELGELKALEADLLLWEGVLRGRVVAVAVCFALGSFFAGSLAFEPRGVAKPTSPPASINKKCAKATTSTVPTPNNHFLTPCE